MIDLWSVQQSIYSALTSAPATYAVYDAVPQGVAKPYIVIGEYTELPDEELSIITADATLTFHTWSAKVGKQETHAMIAFIRDRIDGVVLPGTWFVEEELAEIFEDPASTASSRLYHGVVRYRIR